MSDIGQREYKINIDPRILELLGPSLYTNIYYVLAELIANAYDANAHNVYIIEKENKIIVEDDGMGMSYKEQDIDKYLNVAVETRTSEKDIFVEGSRNKRRKIGRKGIGKLAALTVSEEVLIKTVKNKEKSGFVLSRHVEEDHLLKPISEEDITFEQGDIENGTSIVMSYPEYRLHTSPSAIKNNLLKIFPLVNEDFRIHINVNGKEILIDNFDRSVIESLAALIILDEEFYNLADNFDPGIVDVDFKKEYLLKKRDAKIFELMIRDKDGQEKKYELKIKGWIGAYKTTRERKMDRKDFPDNFISLLSNGKLGEYNIIPVAGKNRLREVYIVGQLHADLFEETSLPDMALSNRQGYKSDDPRYKTVIKYVADDLLPEIGNMRKLWGDYNQKNKKKEKEERQKKLENELREKVERYKTIASQHLIQKMKTQDDRRDDFAGAIKKELNSLLPIIGIKKKIDSQKKRILIVHNSVDKTLADIICKMLAFNNVPLEDIIYTNSENEECRIPEGENIFDYLKAFFVESYSDEKIFVIYVTSDDMARSWYPVTEVGAGWITRKEHKVFNINDHRPMRPLDTDIVWQNSIKNGESIAMKSIEFDKFIVKILDICDQLGYSFRSKQDNEIELKRYVTIV